MFVIIYQKNRFESPSETYGFTSLKTAASPCLASQQRTFRGQNLGSFWSELLQSDGGEGKNDTRIIMAI